MKKSAVKQDREKNKPELKYLLAMWCRSSSRDYIGISNSTIYFFTFQCFLAFYEFLNK